MVVKNYRHEWYFRTVELATLYRKLYTGDGMDTLLKQVIKKEDEAAFSQRVKLTSHIVAPVVQNIMSVFYKVPRANYRRVLMHKQDAENVDLSQKTAILEQIISVFWGWRSLDNYVQTRWLELNATDPNAFVVTEFKPFDNRKERAQPYPFEVYSSQAVDYEYSNNVLQHLITKTEIVMPVRNNNADKKGEKYTVYLENETFTLTQIPSDTSGVPVTKKDEFIFQDGGGFLLTGDKTFVLTFYPAHNAEKVPAKQVGYKRDPFTNGNTYVAPYESAVPRLMKSIKVNSELDLTMTGQVFPHRLQYMPKCHAPGCVDGFTVNNEVCPVCNGTGHASISSAQDVIYIKLPKNSEDLLDLDKLLVFKSPAVDIVTFQKEYLEFLEKACKADVFNSDIFTRSEVAETATGKTLDLQNVYDTLYNCSLGYAEFWEFLVKMTAEFTDLDGGLVAYIVFSKDFKLKGITELLSDLEAANRAGASIDVREAIQSDMMSIIYADNPEGLRKVEARKRHNPFASMSAEQVNMALASSNVPNKLKSKYLLMSAIFADVEQEAQEEGLNFYEIAFTEQKKRIDAKLAEYMKDTDAEKRPVIPNGLPQRFNQLESN